MTLIKNIKHFIYIIGEKKRKIFFFLIFFLFIQSTLEVIGIALVIPLLHFLLKEDLTLLPFYSYIFDISLLNNRENLIVFLLLIILFFFVFKNFFSYQISKSVFKFIYDIQSSLKNLLFSNYVNMNYSEFANTKSSKLISNLSVSCALFSQSFTTPLMFLLSELMILLSIMFFLFFFHTKSFLILVVFIFFVILLYFLFLNKYLKKLGFKKEINENLQVKTISSAIGSIKISKIFNIENILLKDFSNFNQISANAHSKLSTLQYLPRLILEILAFIGLAIVIIFLILTNETYNSIIITLGIFSIASFKLLPSLNRTIFSLQGLSFSDSIFDTLLKNIKFSVDKKYLKKFKKKNIIIKKYISLKNIKFRYENTSRFILNNMDFKILKGKNIGIMGSSGNGKSTFLDVLMGMQKTISGEIIIDGKKINSKTSSWTNNFSYIGQDNYIFDDTLINNIILNKKKINKSDIEKIIKILKILRLKNIIDNSPDGLNTKIGERGINLSGGQIQRIAIARALFRESPIILMDEPTSSLDLDTEKYFFKNLDQICNSTLVIVSHKITTLSNCDQIYVLTKNGILKNYKKN